MNILDTPNEFLDFSIQNYPTGNYKKNFEAYFYNYFYENYSGTEYTYIPIQWTNYLVKNNYGKELDDLLFFLNSKLNKKQKYFTVIQYAGGPIVQLDNCLIFSMGGVFNTNIPKSSSVIPIPLIYDREESITPSKNKSLLACYVGRNTHPVREKIVKQYKEDNTIYAKNLESMNSNISHKDQERFKNLILKSHFSLCPRGFGPTSFRLYESIKLGTVPVYISDYHFLPFAEILDWEKFSILIDKKKIKKLKNIMQHHIDSGSYELLLSNLNNVKNKYFNYEFLSQYVISKIKS